MIISAVIFDLDGTLIDCEKQWGSAFVEVLKSLEYNSSNKQPQTGGVSVKKNWEDLLRRLGINTNKSLDELELMTLNNYVKTIPSISLKPGAIDFIKSLKDDGTRVGLATSTEWWVVEKIFERLRFEGIFDAVVTGEETSNKKPLPDSFLLAADKLGLASQDCLVVGDSQSDVEAAHAAGMKVIVIGDVKNADINVDGFSEITPQVIDRL
ncbi:MAG: Beta-phosphoglucomutase [Microgenomates group bacterium GW2011_GWC1_46_15]|nr:MAG: Beta-phosphoglucomutase [Microgenomates group bacterium GW2011_GWC1_46_15]